MNAAIRRCFARYRQMLPLIAQGIGTVDSIAKKLPSETTANIRQGLYTLRRKFKLIRSVRKARCGAPALYELLVPLKEAMAHFQERDHPVKLTTCALDEVMGTPASVARLIASHAQARLVQRMGSWDDAKGRPKGSVRARA